MGKLLSVIVPCFNEAQALPLFMKELSAVRQQMKEVEFEIICIDDGSKDQTLLRIREFAKKDPAVKYISFSRNFGKESAIYAGLNKACGDYVVIIDADMQDPPNLLPEMYQQVASGEYDSIATRRVTRKGEPILRSFFARCFYKLMNKISRTEIVDGARDYRLMNRKFVNAILSMKEYNRFSKGLFGWVGFRTKWIEFENIERVAGETKWSFWSLFKYSIEGIVSFSTMPLVIASFVGLAFCLLAFAFLIFIIVRKLIMGDPVAGWASSICIILFLGGIQMFTLGIIGQYMSKMYSEIKNRPIYIIKEEETDMIP